MAEKRKLTSFGKKVRVRLIELECSQEWLQSQIREETGLYIDRSYLRKILTGQRSSPKIVQAICGILDIYDSSVEPNE